MTIALIPLIVAVIVGQLAYMAYKSSRRPDNFPPGPPGLPILGSFHYLKGYPERDMLEIAKKYGNIFSLKLYNRNFVCVCGAEKNREALTNANLCERSVTYIFRILKGKRPTGIVHNKYGDALLAYRGLLHKVLAAEKDFLKQSTEDVIKTEVSNVIKQFEVLSKDGEPVSTSNILEMAFVNVLLSVLFGQKNGRFAEDTLKVVELKKAIYTLTQTYADKMLQLPGIVPGLQKIWLPKSAKAFITAGQTMIDYIEAEVKSHEETFDSRNLRDFTDCFLKRMKSDGTGESLYTKHHLITSAFDVFLAGAENTAKATKFALIYLAAHQEIQGKIYVEIMEAIESNADLEWSDRTKLPFTYATMYEVLRFGNLAPNSVPRRALKDFTFNGYSIPKGTVFLFNTYSAHMQEDKWKNAKNFDPENFLNEDGQFQGNEAFMPFGGGMRKCSGASLVKQYIFTLLVKVVENFNIKPESDDIKVDYHSLPGPFPGPRPQKVRLIRRK